MRLSDYHREPVRNSAVDKLPEDVIEQLCAAKRANSHTVPEMIEWLAAEGYDTVTAEGLRQWFTRRGVRVETQ